MKRLGAALAVALTLSATAFGQDELAAEGGQAPRFRLPIYNSVPVGKTVLALDDYVGPEATDPGAKLLLISFMASFCAPCKKEMPYLQRMHEAYAKDGLRVMMVSIDKEPEGQKKIEDLIALNQVTYPVLKDRFNIVALRWLGEKSPLPSVFFIGRDGTIQKVHRGYDEQASQDIMNEVTAALGVEPLPMTPPAAVATKLGAPSTADVVPASAVQGTTPAATPAKSPTPKGVKQKKPTAKKKKMNKPAST